MDSIADWLNSLPFPTMEGNSPLLQSIGTWGYKIYEERGGIQMYMHLLLAALFPIYIGSHASIRCPPSATEPVRKTTSTATTSDGDDDELEKAESPVEGLTPSDAIMFPVFASITLAGLYFLIKWLNDPALLNKILGYYFSLIGIFGVGKLAGDTLNIATTVIFPSLWSSGNKLYVIDPLLSQQVTKEPTVEGGSSKTLHRKFTEKANPFPGALSRLRIPACLNRRLWATRALFTDHWIFRGHIHGVMKVKSRVRLNDVIGFLIGVIAILVYNTSGKVWWLANLMGFGFCYGTLQLMSPTTFWTGSLVLGGLFIYDIVMVFYTCVISEIPQAYL
jgi:minor histocompatibility antigen H13